MVHIPFRNGHKFRTILALSCKLRLVSFQIKLIFQNGCSDVQNRVGTLQIKMCSNVQNRMETPHIMICSDVENRMRIPHIKMCSDVQNKGGDTAL